MKKTLPPKHRNGLADELRQEYHFDYSKARPNRFAGRAGKERVVVVLDPDVSRVFTTPESVNTMLRALIEKMPRAAKRRTRNGKSASLNK
jgi:hypothetical protein